MRKLLVAGALLALCLQAAAEEHLHLVKIVVSGSDRYQAADAVRATGLQENSLVTREQLDAGARRLAGSGVFTSVDYLFTPVRGGIEAQFKVKDRDKFLPAEFENFIWWSDQDLEAALHQAVPLYLGKIGLTGTLPDDVATALDTLLAARGLDSKVVWEKWAAPGELPSVYRFKIASGVPRIKHVELAGADHLPSDVLARFTASFKNRDYLRSSIQKEIERILVPSYMERGYLQFKPGDLLPKIAKDGTLTVSIHVDEGVQYKLAGYSWSGNTVASGEQLSRFLTLKAGEPVNLSDLRANLDAARKFLGKFGREAAVVDPVPTFAGENVTYRFEVHEGDLYRMGDLDIAGLDSASTEKIRGFWKLAPGSPYDNTYVPYFVKHLIMRRQGVSFTCEFVEQLDESEKLVNVRLEFKAE